MFLQEELNQVSMDHLEMLGSYLTLPLHLPPFCNSFHPFFDITQVVGDKKKTLVELLDMGNFVWDIKRVGEKKFIEVTGEKYYK